MSLKQSLEVLKAAGFAVPDVTINYARDRELEARGVKEIWLCNCGFEYESPVTLTEFTHCKKSAKRTWPPKV